MKTATRTENIPLCKKHGEFDPCGECASVPQETPTDYVWHGDSGHPEETLCAICGSQETPAQQELSPCPFGANHCRVGDLRLYELPDSPSRHVFCSACNSCGPWGEGSEEAIRLWNTRYRDPAFQKVLEAAESAADWLCDAHKGSDPWERGQALREALRLARQGEGE